MAWPPLACYVTIACFYSIFCPFSRFFFRFNSDFRALSKIFQRPHPTTKICNTMSQNLWLPPTFWMLRNYIEWSQMSKLYCTEGYYQGSAHCIYKQHHLKIFLEDLFETDCEMKWWWFKMPAWLLLRDILNYPMGRKKDFFYFFFLFHNFTSVLLLTNQL